MGPKVEKAFLPDLVMKRFNDDPEFQLQARYWQGVLEFGVDERTYALNLVDGKVTSVRERLGQVNAPESGKRGKARIAAPSADWEKFLQDPAPPFYLDYYSASLHYGFELSGDPETLWAYYPAIRRTSELLREIARGGLPQ